MADSTCIHNFTVTSTTFRIRSDLKTKISVQTGPYPLKQQKNRHPRAGWDCHCPLSVPINCDRCCKRGSFMEAIAAKVKLLVRRLLLLLLPCLCVFVSGKIPVLHWVPCGCGLGKRHSNAFVTQWGGNCKRFLHNCAFVPLPGGYWASQEPSNTLEWFGTGLRKQLHNTPYRSQEVLHPRGVDITKSRASGIMEMMQK